MNREKIALYKAEKQTEGPIHSYRWVHGGVSWDSFKYEDEEDSKPWQADLVIPGIGTTCSACGNTRDEAIQNMIQRLPAELQSLRHARETYLEIMNSRIQFYEEFIKNNEPTEPH